MRLLARALALSFIASSIAFTTERASHVRRVDEGDLSVGRAFTIEVACPIEAGQSVHFADAPIDRGALVLVRHHDEPNEKGEALRRYDVVPALSGDLVVPPLEFTLNHAEGSSQSLRTEPLSIHVESRAGSDPAAPAGESLRDTFELFDPPRRGRAPSLIPLLVVALAAFLFLLRQRHLRSRRAAAATAGVPRVAPFPGTLFILAQLRARVMADGAESGTTATDVALEAADAVRSALSRRIALPASRRTTDEIVGKLSELDLEQNGDVAHLLGIADDVKYGGALLDRTGALLALDAADRAVAWIGPLPSVAPPPAGRSS